MRVIKLSFKALSRDLKKINALKLSSQLQFKFLKCEKLFFRNNFEATNS